MGIMRKILRAAMTDPSPAIAQVVLVLMKDMCWNQTKIHQLVFEDNVLPLVLAAMQKAGTSEEPVVKAVLIVLRQFCFSDDMKKLVVRREVLTVECCSDQDLLAQQGRL